jgi:uncharacterized protein YgiB involved in biofilm formation
MRKSRTIRLVLLGAGVALTTACDQGPPPDAQFFTGVDDCARVAGEAACREGWAAAERQYAETAPRFDRREACEAEFGEGNCETRETTGGGSIFMPMLMGYMLGSAFRQPVYRGPGNKAMLQTGGRFYDVGRFAGAGQAAPFQKTAVTESRRGGFGETAARYRTSSGG